MARNVNDKIRHILNCSLCSLLLSLCTLVIISFIDVVPSKQASLERLFYFCLIVFVASLSVSLYIIWKRECIMNRYLQRGGMKADELKVR